MKKSYRKPHPLPLPRREGSGMICLLKLHHNNTSTSHLIIIAYIFNNKTYVKSN